MYTKLKVDKTISGSHETHITLNTQPTIINTLIMAHNTLIHNPVIINTLIMAHNTYMHKPHITLCALQLFYFKRFIGYF